jgi:hypothetical protein
VGAPGVGRTAAGETRTAKIAISDSATQGVAPNDVYAPWVIALALGSEVGFKRWSQTVTTLVMHGEVGWQRQKRWSKSARSSSESC